MSVELDWWTTRAERWRDNQLLEEKSGKNIIETLGAPGYFICRYFFGFSSCVSWVALPDTTKKWKKVKNYDRFEKRERETVFYIYSASNDRPLLNQKILGIHYISHAR